MFRKSKSYRYNENIAKDYHIKYLCLSCNQLCPCEEGKTLINMINFIRFKEKKHKLLKQAEINRILKKFDLSHLKEEFS